MVETETTFDLEAHQAKRNTELIADVLQTAADRDNMIEKDAVLKQI